MFWGVCDSGAARITSTVRASKGYGQPCDERYGRCGLTEAGRGICRAGGVREHYVTWEMTWRAAPPAGHVQLGGQRTGHEG